MDDFQLIAMFQIIAGQGAPLYSSNLVDLAINFICDGKDLLTLEHSEEIRQQKYGFGGYLRVHTKDGVHNPLTLAYMRKFFPQFPSIPKLCHSIDEMVQKYDSQWWKERNSDYNPRKISQRLQHNDHNFSDLYLLRFMSPLDLAKALRGL